MSFDNQTLEHLKKLCRIECTPEEEVDILNSLTRVLNYMAELKEVQTDGVKTCRYVLRSLVKKELREDVPGEQLNREVFLNLAPEQIGGMVRVPPVMKTSV